MAADIPEVSGPPQESKPDPADVRLPRYRRLRRYLIIITSIAALAPLVCGPLRRLEGLLLTASPGRGRR